MGTTEGDTQSAAMTSQKVASFMFQGSGEGVTANPLHHSLIWRPKNSEPCGRRGMWVVLLGPDGAGKSAVIAGIASQPSTGFARCETYHLRPTLFSGGREANCDPHGQPVRGTVISLFKLFICWLRTGGLSGSGSATSDSGKTGPVRPLLPRLRGRSQTISSPGIVPANCRCDRQASSSARSVCSAGCSGERAASAETRGHPAGVGAAAGEYAAYAARLQSVVVVDAARPLIEVVREVARSRCRISSGALQDKIRDSVMADDGDREPNFTAICATGVAVRRRLPMSLCPVDDRARWLLPAANPEIGRYWRAGPHIGCGRGWHGPRCVRRASLGERGVPGASVLEVEGTREADWGRWDGEAMNHRYL